MVSRLGRENYAVEPLTVRTRHWMPVYALAQSRDYGFADEGHGRACVPEGAHEPMATVDRDHSYRARDHFRGGAGHPMRCIRVPVKPVGKEELLGQVQRATAASTFALTEGDWRANFVSRSQLMEDRLAIANQAAGSDEPALITGETAREKNFLRVRSMRRVRVARDACRCFLPGHGP